MSHMNKSGNICTWSYESDESARKENFSHNIVELRVFHDGDGKLVVDKECSGRMERMEEFHKKSSKPDGFFGCMSSSNVLSFSTGECNRALLL